MNDLQLGLIGLGVGLVVSVWGYNLWQERRHRRRAEAMLPESAPDVLMKDRDETSARPTPKVGVEPAVRREPVIEAPAGEGGEEAVPPAPTFEGKAAPGRTSMIPPAPTSEGKAAPGGTSMIPPAPTSESKAAPGGTSMTPPASPQTSPLAARVAAPLPAEWADGRADCLLCVEFAEPVSVAALWAEYSSWAEKLDKPVQWLGLDERTGRWRNLLPQDPGAVAQVAAALQLADRRGPVSGETLDAFLQGVHRLAQSFAGLVELPDPAPILATANALDAFCAGVDLQFSLQVVPRPGSLLGMPGGKLKALIDSAGMKLEGERFVATDPDGAVRYLLGCAAATAFPAAKLEGATLTALTFSLDVPRVRDGAATFDAMLAFARQCASAVGGQLVDAHKKPLAEETIMAIRRRIGEIQARMAEQGIPAGSVRALRLFA